MGRIMTFPNIRLSLPLESLSIFCYGLPRKLYIPSAIKTWINLVYCRVRTKKLININVRKLSILALKCTFWVKICLRTQKLFSVPEDEHSFIVLGMYNFGLHERLLGLGWLTSPASNMMMCKQQRWLDVL